MWHGFADQLIVPGRTIDCYDVITQTVGGGYKRTQQFARLLFMAPGIGHCGGDAGAQPQRLFAAVVDWVEHEHAPDSIPASKPITGGTQTRPLCPYPTFAVYKGGREGPTTRLISCAGSCSAQRSTRRLAPGVRREAGGRRAPGRE